MKYQFIDNHRFEFPVVKMCQTLKIAKSGFYYWLENRGNKKLKDQNLLLKIKTIFEKSKQIYGRKRLTKALNKDKFQARFADKSKFSETKFSSE
jgi:putative transposase